MIRNSTRRGFTLVEVLVAAGLSMLIMVMVTTAFQRGMDSLSRLKSVGELQQRLRAFEQVMVADLQSDHFDGKYGPKVSDQRLDKVWYPTGGTAITNDLAQWRPPVRGFFRIVNDINPNSTVLSAAERDCIWEGTEPPPQNNPSTRAVDHMLAMTVKRNAARGDKLFSARMPSNMAANAWTALGPCCLSQMNVTANTVNSEWAEVIYFLDIQNPAGRTKGGTPLYGLYRRVRVLPGTGNPATVNVIADMHNPASALERPLLQDLCTRPNATDASRRINTPESIRDPRNRLGGMLSDRSAGGDMNTQWDYITREQNGAISAAAPAATDTPTGGDLLLTDVISFEIKADWEVPPGSGIAIPAAVTTDAGVNCFEFPFNILPNINAARNPKLGGRRIFDTWYDTTAAGTGAESNWITVGTIDTIPQPIRMRAVQIKVRIWDRKNNIARQVTIIQDL